MATVPGPAIAAAAVTADATAAPSFACDRATGAAERIVCADPSLALLDRGLAIVYRRALAGTQARGLVPDERAWLKKRDACRTAACLRDSYRGQLEAVFESVSGGSGDYRRTDGQAALTVIDVPSSAAVAFRITATYTGRSVNVGSVEGVVALHDNRARFVSNDSGQPCILDLRRAGVAWSVVTLDPSGCALGHNVTVDGRYLLAHRTTEKRYAVQ